MAVRNKQRRRARRPTRDEHDEAEAALASIEQSTLRVACARIDRARRRYDKAWSEAKVRLERAARDEERRRRRARTPPLTPIERRRVERSVRAGLELSFLRYVEEEVGRIAELGASLADQVRRARAIMQVVEARATEATSASMLRFRAERDIAELVDRSSSPVDSARSAARRDRPRASCDEGSRTPSERSKTCAPARRCSASRATEPHRPSSKRPRAMTCASTRRREGDSKRLWRSRVKRSRRATRSRARARRRGRRPARCVWPRARRRGASASRPGR